MKRLLKFILGLVIVYIIIRVLIEYLQPVDVWVEEHVPPSSPPEPPSTPPPPPAPERMDLNQAGVDALTRLPGIGPALAERIVAYRQQAGAFATLDDLTQVRGIGPSLVEQLRPRIKLGPADQLLTS